MFSVLNCTPSEFAAPTSCMVLIESAPILKKLSVLRMVLASTFSILAQSWLSRASISVNSSGSEPTDRPASTDVRAASCSINRADPS